MPDIHLYFKLPAGLTPGKHALLEDIGKQLPVLAAEHLSFKGEGGTVEPDTCNVFFHEKGPNDILTHDLVVRIEVCDLTGRHDDIKDRSHRIREALSAEVGSHQNVRGQPWKLTCHVWTKLEVGGISKGEIIPDP